MPALMFAIGADSHLVIPGLSEAKNPESIITDLGISALSLEAAHLVVMDSGFTPAACPGMTVSYSDSAVSCFALAIQPSTRPGRPTSSPTLWAAVGDSSAICV